MNVADMLRAELLNYELEIQLAESRAAYWTAVMEKDKGSQSKRRKRRQVAAKVRAEMWESFRDELLQAKHALAHGIDLALGSYPPTHRKIFWACLLEQRPESEVASECGMTEYAVKRIRAKLVRDLHDLYRP